MIHALLRAKGLFSRANCEFQGGYIYIYIRPYIAEQLIDQSFSWLYTKSHLRKLSSIWRCISYWKWRFSNVMLVFRGVIYFLRFISNASKFYCFERNYLSVFQARCITKIHRTNGGTLGARGPLNNQPYIIWVFIGSQIPLQKRDPTKGLNS